MSWFKKIMNMMKDDDIEDRENIESVNQRQVESSNRNIEAKVKYQYPKGNFRFPIIPDEKQQPVVGRNRNYKQLKPLPKQETPVKEKVNIPKREIKQDPITEKKQFKPMIKQPFKPTEIPSPIYGFNRPRPIQTDDKPLEFELSSSQDNRELMSKRTMKSENRFSSIQGNHFEKNVDKIENDKFEGNNTASVLFDKRVPQDALNVAGVQTEDLQSYQESTHHSVSIEETMHEVAATVTEMNTVEEIKTLPIEEFSIINSEEVENNLESAYSDDLNEADEEFPVSHNVEETSFEVTQNVQQEETYIATSNYLDHDTTLPENLESDVDLSSETTKWDNYDYMQENPLNNTIKEEGSTRFLENDLVGQVVEENLIETNNIVPEERINIFALEEDENNEATAVSDIVDHEEMIIENVNSSETSNMLYTEEFDNDENNHDSDDNVDGGVDEQDQPVRSHIPFNVVMLKKDRQKWEVAQYKMNDNAANMTNISDSKNAIQENMVNSVKETDLNRESTVETMTSNTSTEREVAVEKREEFEKLERYVFPANELLSPPIIKDSDEEWIAEQSKVLNETLKSFNVKASVVHVSQGPSVTRFEVQPEPGVKVNKITNLSDDIKLSLAAKDIRIEAPIPGKHTVGIELPNAKSNPVMLSEIITSPEFKHHESPLTAALGLDISGKPIITDLRKMPHGLIAGATGSGKSVCINSILVSLLYKAKPNELKLLLIDPKMVELAPYNRIPHLVSPVITDVKAATAALKWAVEEMERRYELFAHTGVRDIQRFNELAERNKQYNDKLPYIVIIIDELADLMMMSPADVEEAICRIAQKARACGIHLIIATQRPSVDVITGLIKANVPTRIAFSVSSQIDSRTIIDMGGAEKLLGRGDMLFLENGSSKSVRLQGTFVSDDEIDRVVKHVRQEQQPNYLFEQEELLKKAQVQEEEDELFIEACEFVIDAGGASTSLLQRHFRIGYNRAARLIEMMEQQGIISEARGSKPRDILMTKAELEIE